MSAVCLSNTRRWISRDPVGEKAGPDLYAYCSDNPIGDTDPLGLEESGAGTAHVSGDRHNNYLIFKKSCPKCKKVANVKANYNSDAMFQAMFSAVGGGPSYLLDNYENAVNAGLSTNGGGAGFGGIQDPGKPNCSGDPVEVHAYMRTRLVGPGLQFSAWRLWNDTPDPQTMVGIYVNNTRIEYDCVPCNH